MKKIDTEYIDGKKADLEEIKYIIENLYSEEDTEEWICLFDTSKKNPNYIQVTSDIEDYEDDAAQFCIESLHYDNDKIDSIEKIFMLEFRKYNNDEFKHYRAFLDNENLVIPCFEYYMNDDFDKIIGCHPWLDVTDEF